LKLTDTFKLIELVIGKYPVTYPVIESPLYKEEPLFGTEYELVMFGAKESTPVAAPACNVIEATELGNIIAPVILDPA
jgi:hypothetical protein